MGDGEWARSLVGIGAAIALLVPTALARPATAQAQVSTPSVGGGASAGAFELTFWQSVAASDDQAQLEAYLAAYPTGAFSNLARLKIAALRQRQTPVAEPSAPPAMPPAAIAVAAVPVAVPVPPPATPPATPAPMAVAVSPTSLPSQAPSPVSAPDPSGDRLVASVDPLADQLRLLASGQGIAPGEPRSAPVKSSGLVVPAAPDLAILPELRLPPRFCSAEERNLFYDSDYKPAMELADRNNQAAIAHLQALQDLYDQRGRMGDIAGQNQLAAASREYGAVAAEAFRARSAYDAIFNRMLAVPISPCPASGA